MPHISVIIPCYNCQEFISETLESLACQSYRDFEVICVNDGSTDETQSVLEAWQANRKFEMHIVNQENGGVSRARNAGIVVASGEYITFLDSDDLYHPEFLNALFRAATQNNADTAYCRLSRNYEKDLDNYIKRYNWYATREMQDYIDFTRGASTQINTDKAILAQRKKKFGFYYKMPRYVRAWAWFLYNYIFRGGFLDGREGFVFCFLECYWYRLLVDAKIFEYEKTGGEFEQLKAID